MSSPNHYFMNQQNAMMSTHNGTGSSSVMPSMHNAATASLAAAASTKTAKEALSTAESLFNTQLASALSTISDSQYFEDSISPSVIRSQLSQSDPSNPSSTPNLLRGMKWLLACMSKGRDVSDFFPHVVKLVGSHNLEVRKMVYMYLVHYADHDKTCRELALLSINAFQRGLGDSEQWIRALALRVLSSIRVMDILQIQVLAVNKCSKDRSPYVRKCAANALGKLFPRAVRMESGRDKEQVNMILEIMVQLLNQEQSTMVLTSVLTSFVEICPDRLDLLHTSFRKICKMLTDMDEWGQVIILDLLARYCRRYFREPGSASAEIIDLQRRVVRSVSGIHNASIIGDADDKDDLLISTHPPDISQQRPSRRTVIQNTKVKKRVVKKAFYSDEEDESGEEEVFLQNNAPSKSHDRSQSIASAMKQRNVLGFGNGVAGIDHNAENAHLGGVAAAKGDMDDEDLDLDPDHRLILRSSLPLLKSRNSAVVLAVCSLHYYCGVASIKIRSALGKSLVRIYHDRREIQYVVLQSIKTLVWECPSAFTPFLNDFFVKAMDPSFTRLIKLDILTALALEPNSINAVLKELRTYIRHDDKTFVCASIQAVGKIAQMARVVYDRQGRKTGNIQPARYDANVIALNCLFGLLTLTECSNYETVVGECVVVIQRILLLLISDDTVDNSRGGGGGFSALNAVDDPFHVQSIALRRLVLLLVRSLSSIGTYNGKYDCTEDDEDDEGANLTLDEKVLRQHVTLLPTNKVAPALWIIGEWLSTTSVKSKSKPSIASLNLFDTDNAEKKLIQSEILRLLAKSFHDLEPVMKNGSIHFASKIFLSAHTSSSTNDIALCEYILGMGRVDVNQDVRDRARYESLVLHMTIGLSHDVENLSTPLPCGNIITLENAEFMLLQFKPCSSWLPIENDWHGINDLGVSGSKSTGHNNPFRFGTLSSMVSHKAGSNNAYLPLPSWAKVDSDKKLRDPPQPKVEERNTSLLSKSRKIGDTKKSTASGFYDSDDEDGISSSSDDDDNSSASDSDSSESGSKSSSDESSSEGDSDVNEESSDDEESNSDKDSDEDRNISPGKNEVVPNVFGHVIQAGSTTYSQAKTMTFVDVLDEVNDSNSYESESESESDNDESSASSGQETGYPEIKTNEDAVGSLLGVLPDIKSSKMSGVSSLAQGLEGLVMSPLVVDTDGDTSNPHDDIEKESSVWNQVIRHELAGGLSMELRYLRGLSRDREAKLLGLDPKNPSVMCVHIKFENRRTDGGILRRIRIIKRNATKNGTIGVNRVIIPQEIGLLNKTQKCLLTLGLEFLGTSDKEGAMLARFDVKSDRGSSTVDIRPPLAEFFTRCSMNYSEFDSAVEKLHGMHQRSVSSFTLKNRKDGDSLKKKHKDLPARICKHTNLSPVGKNISWSGNSVCKFIAVLPASSLEVAVVVKCDPQTGSGEIMVCCDNTMILNHVMELVKGAVI